MPRKPRLHFPGAVYHVILRGNAREDIFFEDADRYRFYLLLQEGVERFRHRILSFCLMTNHVHLAVQVADIPLSRILQNLSFRYTKWINWRRSRSGHLFQGRYKAFIVDTDPYLLQLVSYIHLNPVRAGVAKDVGAYQWSSHRAYLGKETMPWLDADPVLGHFSKSRQKARRAFDAFVAGRATEGHREEFHGKRSSDSRFVGDDVFVDEILQKENARPIRKPDLEAVLAGVQKSYGLTFAEIAAPGQKRLPSEARMMAAWAIRELSSSTLSQFAHMTGRDPSAMSAAAARFAARIQQKKELTEKAEALREELEASLFHAAQPKSMNNYPPGTPT